MDKEHSKSNALFCFCWILICGYTLLIERSEIKRLMSWNYIEKAVYLIVGLLLVYKIIAYDSKIKKKTLILVVAAISLVAIVSLKSVGIGLIIQLLLILAARNVDFKKIIKTDMKLRIFCTITLFILCLLGFIKNYSAEFYGGATIKNAFGWTHPNMFGASVLTIFIEWIYLSWNNKKGHILQYVIFVVGILLLDRYSSSRTQIYTFSFILVAVIIIKLWPSIMEKKIFKSAMILSSPICATISYIAVKLYEQGNSIGIIANQLLTGRIAYSAYFLRTYGISFLGEKINLVSSRIASLKGTTAYILDMSYIKLIVMYGMIFFVFFIIMHSIMQNKLVNKKHIPEAIMILYFAIVGIASTSLLSVFTNPTLFLVWALAEKKQKENNDIDGKENLDDRNLHTI